MTPVPYPLTLGLHSQTDIVEAINDLHARLAAIEAIWSAHARSHDSGDTLVVDRIERLEQWAKQFPPLGVISGADGKPQSVTGPATYTIPPGIILNPHGPPVVGNGAGCLKTAAPGSDAAADIEVLQAEIAALKTQLDQEYGSRDACISAINRDRDQLRAELAESKELLGSYPHDGWTQKVRDYLHGK